MARRRLALSTFLVRDYDEAIAFFVDCLRFALIEDTPRSETKRWVVVAPGDGVGLLLAKAVGDAQRLRVGDQTSGRVAFFLYTDEFEADRQAMTAKGVRFLEDTRHEPYGTVAVFEDLYGNRWDLLGPAVSPAS